MSKKELVQENLTSPDKLVSSNSKTSRVPHSTQKYVLSIDNLRVIAYALPESHEEYSLDSFEYTGNSYLIGPLTETSRELLETLKTNSIFELRYGTYRAEKVYTKR